LLLLVGFGCITVAAILWLLPPEQPPQQTATILPPPLVRPSAAAPPTVAHTAVPTLAPTAAPTIAPAVPTPAPQTATPLATQTPLPATAGESGSKPRLAIIIDDCGQWPVTEHGFVALPFPVTLSVLPHVRFGSEIARDASAAGKGVILHLPMQTISGEYPGPGTITTTMPDAEIRNEVSSDLAELPQARGVNNHEGSLATQDPRVMGDVMDVLAHDGRFFIDSRTSSASVGESVARGRGVPTAGRDVFLDNVDSEPAIAAQMRQAIAEARATGSAIAIGHPRPATLAVVRGLGAQAARDGIQLTLASALVH
jgi:polysaccharide deacetylase 2 family uncharacterized protein YibQ